MAQNVAVINEVADIGPAKVHSQLYAGIRSASTPERNLYRVTVLLVQQGFAVLCKKQEVNLMNMELMVFQSTIFNRPILDGALRGNNGGRVIRG